MMLVLPNPLCLFMLDFFRKRFGKVPAPAPVAVQQGKSPAIAEVSVQARQIALSQAEEVAGDEAAATEFILRCEYAEARLVAAAHIHSRPMVERVLAAMRNSDRRVVKMMQARLDICKQWEADEQQANHCISEAVRLGVVPHLMPNQVAALDKQWQKISHVLPPQQQAFDSARLLLQQRLAEQISLQRAVTDALLQLRSWKTDAAFNTSADAEQQLAAVERRVAELITSPEAASLPKHLPAEVAQAVVDCMHSIHQAQQCQEGITARQALLAQWEAAEIADLIEATLLRDWHKLPPLPDGALMAPLQARMDDLIARIRAASPAAEPEVLRAPQQVRHSSQDSQKPFADALARLEQALQDGALQAAAEQNKVLQQLDLAAVRPTAAQTSKLVKMRAELAHLQGWARWGANVSREELLHAAESLAALPLPPLELSKKVGSLRERWKSLDTVGGPVSKELWQRFDQACSTAYAPAAAHFQQLAEERRQNAAQAQTLIGECEAYADAFDCTRQDDDIDWKALASFLDRARQAWHRLGTIDRKERKALEAAFNDVLARLAAPLTARRSQEVSQREQLITQAAQLNPHARGTFDELRQLQERWQQQAKLIPLERRQEQALWQRFRAQCDQVFATRKELSQSADAERQQNLQQKEALCLQLENIDPEADAAAISTLLHETRQAWHQTGPLPRAAEGEVEGRYQKAAQRLQQQLDKAQRDIRVSALASAQARLRFCQMLEHKLAMSIALSDDVLASIQAEWNMLPPTLANVNGMLEERFAAIIAALRSADHAYALKLENNRQVLMEQLLRLEIILGLESPAELSRERLQLQVSVLQSAFKSGQKPSSSNQNEPLQILCQLPALVDTAASDRMAAIFDWYKSN